MLISGCNGTTPVRYSYIGLYPPHATEYVKTMEKRIPLKSWNIINISLQIRDTRVIAYIFFESPFIRKLHRYIQQMVQNY
jgi:hypothetical protein